MCDCYVDGECSPSGFLSKEDLRENATLNIPNFVVVENDYILFEHLNITQNGSLTKWIFTAEDRGEGDKYPDLLIFRMINNTENRRTVLVTAVTLPGSRAVPTNNVNVYEYTVQNDTQVKAGDQIAIMLPPISNARLLLSFVRNGGPEGINLRKRAVDPVSGREGDLPLVTLEISNDILTFHV